jgi:hypothetical protein
MRINNNLMALNTQRYLSINNPNPLKNYRPVTESTEPETMRREWLFPKR